ncbi:MAG: hypothetical protein CVV27_07550 [Candidatus Melainabacteria bacterium HGW-Melainabacteria-1]|nr:MAG: hypothetical protein CVV27_07550 [Candidatus Melainabacteria bacterium HGW-Melainabacteria-1]
MRTAIFLFLLTLAACSPSAPEIFLPVGDIKPPSLIKAGQSGPDAFDILFDEDIEPVADSFSFLPTATMAKPKASGSLLTVSLEPAAKAGEPCSLSGEARDASGNTTRFLFSFVGYNGNPVPLRLNEVQPGKNSSASNLHRDYIEFVAMEGGNLGGVQVQWASSVKVMSFVFPPCNVAEGEVVVLHCSPEGLPGEVNEAGSDLTLSEGVDASAEGRDFWTDSGGIPDETGLILLRPREGHPPVECLFFASSAKTGAVDALKFFSLLGEAAEESLWPCSSPPLWEEGFIWKSSTSKPLHRMLEGEVGPSQWYVGDSGSQSPGLVPPSNSSRGSKKSKGGMEKLG